MLRARYGLKVAVVTNNGREFLSYLLKPFVSYAREEDRKRLHS